MFPLIVQSKDKFKELRESQSFITLYFKQKTHQYKTMDSKVRNLLLKYIFNQRH